MIKLVVTIVIGDQLCLVIVVIVIVMISSGKGYIVVINASNLVPGRPVLPIFLCH